jgi:hypothetical protein
MIPVAEELRPGASQERYRHCSQGSFCTSTGQAECQQHISWLFPLGPDAYHPSITGDILAGCMWTRTEQWQAGTSMPPRCRLIPGDANPPGMRKKRLLTGAELPVTATIDIWGSVTLLWAVLCTAQQYSWPLPTGYW